MKQLQESGEMYLETIQILSLKSDKVRSLDVAEYMNFSKPSVSRAVGILKRSGYITIDNEGFILLTDLGKQTATKIYQRHQVITQFLESLGVEHDIAEADACKIEHDISEETFLAIKKQAK